MIAGKKIGLRFVEQRDLPLLAELGSLLNEYTPFQAVNMQPETVVRQRFSEGGYWSEERGFMLIVHPIDQRILGEIGFFKNAPYRAGFELGYRIHKQVERGQGYMTEALRLFSAYLFALKPIPRLQVAIIADNTPSRRVAEKAGFVYEGTLRQASFVRGEYHDLVVYGLLRAESPDLASLLAPAPPDFLKRSLS